MVGSGKYKRKRALVNKFISRSAKKRKAGDIFGVHGFHHERIPQMRQV